MDPVILFFLFGVVLGLAKSDFRLPKAVYEFVSIMLLITIGLKGGVELSKQPFADLLPKVLLVLVVGLVLPVIAYPILKRFGKFKREDAASIAAHYGSVSVGTFAVTLAYLNTRGIPFEEYMALFVVILEIPAILVGIVLARGISKDTDWKKVSHEVFLGKGVALLVGGLFVGWLAGPVGVQSIAPLFFDLFKGILALFLLEMGIVATAQLSSLKKYGFFLIVFGVIMPIFSGVIGIFAGQLMGLSVGGITVMATLTASASYIAVPAAMRISVPEANPTLSLTASLGITFPFNILAGIPLYYFAAQYISF